MKKDIFVFLLALGFLCLILFTIVAEDITGDTVTGRAIDASLSVSISVLALPTITIIKPENETYLTTKNLLLNYTSLGEDFVWYNLDSGDNITITSSVNFNTTSGIHTLYLYTNNSEGEVSKNVTFTVDPNKFKIYYSEFAGSDKGTSIDFNESSYEDLQNLSGIILEQLQHGKIVFNEAINLTNDSNVTDNEINISAHVNISSNRIEINTTALPNFNKSATLRLYNLTFSNPRILRDGNVCPSSICTKESYSGVGGTLVFNVTHFSVYSSEETPEDDVTPPSGGGGISTKKSFTLSIEEIKVSLKQGQVVTKNIIITNDGTQSLIFTIENPTLRDFLKISETSFELNSGESKTIILDIIIREDTFPNLYIGKLIIKADGLEKEILVAVEIESSDALFDVTLEIPKRYLEVLPGEEILGEIKLYNLGELGRIDVKVEYIIKDENNNVVTTASDTIAVETQTSFIKSVLIPKNAKYGRHMFYVRITYNSKVASASTFFEIVEPGISEKEKLYIIFIIFLIMLLSIIVYYSVRHRIKSHRKIVKKVDIRDLLKI